MPLFPPFLFFVLFLYPCTIVISSSITICLTLFLLQKIVVHLHRYYILVVAPMFASNIHHKHLLKLILHRINKFCNFRDMCNEMHLKISFSNSICTKSYCNVIMWLKNPHQIAIVLNVIESTDTNAPLDLINVDIKLPFHIITIFLPFFPELSWLSKVLQCNCRDLHQWAVGDTFYALIRKCICQLLLFERKIGWNWLWSVENA